MKERWPEDFVARDEDKYGYRYPRGESYEVNLTILFYTVMIRIPELSDYQTCQCLVYEL